MDYAIINSDNILERNERRRTRNKREEYVYSITSNNNCISNADTAIIIFAVVCRTGSCLRPARARLSTLSDNEYADILLMFPHSTGN